MSHSVLPQSTAKVAATAGTTRLALLLCTTVYYYVLGLAAGRAHSAPNGDHSRRWAMGAGVGVGTTTEAAAPPRLWANHTTWCSRAPSCAFELGASARRDQTVTTTHPMLFSNSILHPLVPSRNERCCKTCNEQESGS